MGKMIMAKTSHSWERIEMLLLLLLVGCSTAQNFPTATLHSPAVPTLRVTDALPTSQLALPSSTPVPPSATAPLPFTLTPRPPTATPVPILTPLASPVSPSNELEWARQMLQTNGGCELPCWWGLTPGKTKWAEAYDFFTSLRKTFQVNPVNESRGVGFGEPGDDLIVGLNFTLDRQDNAEIKRIFTTISTSELEKQPLERYLPSYMLDQFGKPAQVFLEYNPTLVRGDTFYGLVMFYPDQGIMIEYYDRIEKRGANLRFCPDDTSTAFLWLWDPANGSVSPDDLYANGSTASQSDFAKSYFQTEYHPLQEATGIDVATFSQMFQKAEVDVCLEAPFALWDQPAPTWTAMPGTPTPAPTSTPVLLPGDEIRLIEDIFRFDPNCDVPCWGGFTPGETKWSTVWDFFAAQGKDVYIRENGDLGIALDGGMERGFNVNLNFVVVDKPEGTIQTILVDLNEWYKIKNPDTQRLDTQRFLLSQVIERFGVPSQILLQHDPVLGLNGSDYGLLLFYPDQGLMVEYVGRSQQQGTDFEFCPDSMLRLMLWFWQPGTELSPAELYARVSDLPRYQRKAYPEPPINYLLLEQATGLDPAAFSQMVLDGSLSCLETPADLWQP
ncbi:MAG: hypothetical protein JW862_14560 [Anaerolineales bacterium]|nr:hypothetical protein [Anaerolineales bacterium]